MSLYSFNVRKGQIQISLETSDKELISSQFEVWVKKASEYAKKLKVQQCKEMVNDQINTEREITQQKIDEQLRRKEAEHSMEEKNKNLDIFYAPKKEEENPVIKDTPIEEPQNEVVTSQQEETNQFTNISNVNFDNLLENSMNNPKTELSFKPSPSIKKDNAFLNFMNGRTIERKIDYLLLTAYYLTQYDQKPRFTLKQLNAKLMQNLAIIIDHSVLQEAINRDYIECLPDLTGLVGASEYRLTAYGEKVLLDE